MDDNLEDWGAALLEDSFLDACLAETNADDLQYELVRNDSSASNASTALAPTPCGEKIRVKAFCSFNMYVVELFYPDASTGWVYRADIGGPSHHRWEYGDTIFLTSRHTTCTKGIVPRDPCRNCVMKSVWRRECIEPCNVFYIDPQRSAEACLFALQSLALSAVKATPSEVTQYTLFAPKPSSMRKRSLDTTDKIVRNARSLENLRQSVSGSTVPFEDEEEAELPKPVQPSIMPVATTVIAPSPQRPTSLLPASPHRHITVACAYERLIFHLHQINTACAVSVPLASFRMLVAQHAPTFVEHSMLARLPALDKLAQLMGVPDSMQLFLKAIFSGWLRILCDTFYTDSAADVYVGFYVPPTIGFYRDLYNESLMPAIIAQSSHRIDSCYATAVARCKVDVKPVLMAYFLPNGHMVKGRHMLPLGVKIGD